MTKAFISYHHDNDQRYKEHVSYLADQGAFDDCSIKVGHIDESLPAKAIRKHIRNKYLRNTKVTILLCGTETQRRKHIDWELVASMASDKNNPKSGILVINLPTVCNGAWCAALGKEEKKRIYPDCTEWGAYESRGEFMMDYPYMPDRIIDNLVRPDVDISIVPWDRIENNVANLKFLVDKTAKVGPSNKYDYSRPRREHDRVGSNERLDLWTRKIRAMTKHPRSPPF